MRTIQQPLAGRRFAVLTLLLGGFTAFGPLSMDLYLPAFPQLAADLGASQAAVQLTLTADVIGPGRRAARAGSAVGRPRSPWPAHRLDARLRDRLGAVRARAVRGDAVAVAFRAGRVRRRR